MPLLQASLRPEPVAFLVLDCLRQIGPAASALIPELRRILHSEERYFKGWGDDVCALDEAFCEACAETIRAIETQP
ncbi:MAG TPA: hypothetical protein VMP01_21125 [Pirellulaceae bacterium]|nr:hypothetical protein [Pirellulaceae bacterium]